MDLPFTATQFFEVFAAFNRALWPFALALWMCSVAGAVRLARRPARCARFISGLLAVHWVWAGLAYHAAFFSAINPAAWLFAALFVAQGALLWWFGVVRGALRFSPNGSPRHAIAWVLIVAALIYPALTYAEGHVFPAAPAFGIPCPTTLLTLGCLLAADRRWPRALAAIPIAWAFIAGSTALQLGVRADLLLWAGALALIGHLLTGVRAGRVSMAPNRRES